MNNFKTFPEKGIKKTIILVQQRYSGLLDNDATKIVPDVHCDILYKSSTFSSYRYIFTLYEIRWKPVNIWNG